MRRDKIANIDGLLAVEMEGTAIGQVCAEHGAPCVVARIAFYYFMAVLDGCSRYVVHWDIRT